MNLSWIVGSLGTLIFDFIVRFNFFLCMKIKILMDFFLVDFHSILSLQ